MEENSSEKSVESTNDDPKGASLVYVVTVPVKLLGLQDYPNPITEAAIEEIRKRGALVFSTYLNFANVQDRAVFWCDNEEFARELHETIITIIADVIVQVFRDHSDPHFVPDETISRILAGKVKGTVTFNSIYDYS